MNIGRYVRACARNGYKRGTAESTAHVCTRNSRNFDERVQMRHRTPLPGRGRGRNTSLRCRRTRSSRNVERNAERLPLRGLWACIISTKDEKLRKQSRRKFLFLYRRIFRFKRPPGLCLAKRFRLSPQERWKYLTCSACSSSVTGKPVRALRLTNGTLVSLADRCVRANTRIYFPDGPRSLSRNTATVWPQRIHNPFGLTSNTLALLSARVTVSVRYLTASS